jgi:hypothetical protein
MKMLLKKLEKSRRNKGNKSVMQYSLGLDEKPRGGSRITEWNRSQKKNLPSFTNKMKHILSITKTMFMRCI